MKPDPQTYKRKSGRGLFLMCAGVMAVLLSESVLFLVLGGALEVIGLLLFVGGMWQQKKQREAEQSAADSPEAAAPDLPAPCAPDAPSPDADASETPAPQADPPEESRPGWEYDS